LDSGTPPSWLCFAARVPAEFKSCRRRIRFLRPLSASHALLQHDKSQKVMRLAQDILENYIGVESEDEDAGGEFQIRFARFFLTLLFSGPAKF
jgi:hypothetical protein